jgi:hypothetical protein
VTLCTGSLRRGRVAEGGGENVEGAGLFGLKGNGRGVKLDETGTQRERGSALFCEGGGGRSDPKCKNERFSSRP